MDLPSVKSPWRTLVPRKDNHELRTPQDETDNIHRHSPFRPLPRPLPSRLQCQTRKDASPLRCSRPPSTGPPAISTRPTRILFVVLFFFLVSTTAVTTKNIGVDDEVNLDVAISSRMALFVFLLLFSLGPFVFAPPW